MEKGREWLRRRREQFKSMGFELEEGKKRCIHEKESRRFMKEVVGAGGWSEKVLEEGLKVEFREVPGKYSERNNKSALSKMEVVREKVAEWEQKGYVEKIAEPAHCNNPLSVAAKIDHSSGRLKFRPCIDLSRHVNKCVRVMHVKLDDLSQSESLLEKGDFLTAFDMESQFFHVKLAEEQRKFFGFTVVSEEGKEEYYQFVVMPFGLSSAVAVVTKLLQPVKAFLHKLGIRISIYVDDGRLVAASKAEVEEQLTFVLEVLQLCGWNIQWAKTDGVGSQQLVHLGFVTDTQQMKYFYPA